ncbi:MAG: hypothetical protein JRF61_01260 [Deltaproteobacteria bacterium]|nr:hypothetical protein [Deltaproteobacteria bacterium]
MGKTFLVLGLMVHMIGCAGTGDPYFDESGAYSAEDEAPLGGEALAQRRTDLDRAWRDLLHFDATMQSLVDRRDGRSVALLDSFLAQYMEEHLDPMLAPAWQSSHPELMALDANLRFMKAQLLADMRYTRRVQDAIEDIEIRFMGREGMLVEYPVGEQRPLGEALVLLRESKWNS